MSIGALKPLERKLRKALLGRERPFAGRLIDHPQEAFGLGPSPRILVVRLERLGDVLVGIPVIRAIRRRYPSAVIDLLLSRANAGVAPAVRPWVNNVWCYDKRPASALRLIGQFRRAKYDLMVDLVTGPSAISRVLASWSRIPRVLGVLHQRPTAYTHAVPALDRRRVHIVRCTAQLLLPFGIDPDLEDLALEYPLSDADRLGAERLLPHVPGRLRLGVNLSGRGPDKYWGRDQFVEAIRWMQRHHPRFSVVVCGSPDYAGEVASVAAATGAQIAPPLPDFHEFAAFIGTLDLVLTPDTSVVHVAAGLEVPLVGLYRPDPDCLPWTPYASRHRALVHAGPLSHIPVPDVVTALEELIAECFPAGD